MADGLSREDVERLMFFEQAREQAEADFAKNNQDATALTRWGGALLELAHFRSGEESYSMIQTAVVKFKKAISIDSTRHDTKWCLGNAYTSQGFLTAERETALEFFTLATQAFQEAYDQDPSNIIYSKALEMTQKAPELHTELQRQLAAQGETLNLGGGLQRGTGGGGKESAPASALGLFSDTWYDIGGWAVLIGLGVAITFLSRGASAQAPVAIK